MTSCNCTQKYFRPIASTVNKFHDLDPLHSKLIWFDFTSSLLDFASLLLPSLASASEVQARASKSAKSRTSTTAGRSAKNGRFPRFFHETPPRLGMIQRFRK